MTQVTLISLYGDKPTDLALIIKKCWEFIHQSKLRRVFHPYDMRQVHGTLIGLEKRIGFTKRVNANYYREHNKTSKMDFDCLLRIVKKKIPIQVRFGGFSYTYRAFKSNGLSPYNRSFQIQWDNGKVVLIGWPFDNKRDEPDFASRPILWDLRKQLEDQCKVRHKHGKDNDLFVVIGELKGLEHFTDEELSAIRADVGRVEQDVRNFLAQTPIVVEITKEDVFVAQYTRETLPLDSTNVYCIQDPTVNSRRISRLYS